MLTVISSSKTQRTAMIEGLRHTQPFLPDKTAALVHRLQQLSQKDLELLLAIRTPLARETMSRYKNFVLPHVPESAGSALASFRGDVFSALPITQYSPDELLFADRHLRILSGLYGILSPLTLMQPYRLEMATSLAPIGIGSLYEYWRNDVVDLINQALKEQDDDIVINCASHEYARVIDRHRLAGRMLTVVFKQQKNGKTTSIAIHAKRARGQFVDWLITNRIDRPDLIPGFDRGGYHYLADQATEDTYTFTCVL